MQLFQDPVPAGEAEQVQAIVEAVLTKQKAGHKPGQLARRDVHAKSHGTVAASFRVLPQACNIGLFSKPASYDALVRFSNGAFGPGGFDILPNVRGLALKLFGVPGPKLLPGDENSTEHDFLFSNDPTFFVRTIEDMLLITQGKIGKLSLGAKLRIAGSLKLMSNPLHGSYFSQVPYQLGERACKYALIPQKAPPLVSLPRAYDRDYLRHAVETELRRHEVKYTFAVQLQRSGESIADSTVPWRGALVPVAELVFLKLSRALLESDGEALSFNPWRALAEHQPLGWPGRVRKEVYAADFKWRSEQNHNS
ncbi:MAG: hypothetical protein K2X27_25745 [Candidatus Obscuribacterales bacterium]|nr:hypothetical protein [Candidatus Obscuribacterales bacterium]